ncbi:41 kDa spicule matrix protein-like [Pieris rapae]|uniref:41 kDa spicule matrix protein-like n=1 Tax=Pieris rapae TaxID=64459 RepID=UPI001E27C727|nr:41 kDa spicule matrix protein-like [Pieris rapae]
MKLFLIAAVIAVSSAARLEHLERSYLPPDSNSVSGGFGSRGSNGFGSGHFGASARGSQGGFNGGNAGAGVDSGFSGSLNGFGSSNNGAVDGLKQYLPPHQSGSNFGGSAIKPACSSCGFARQQSFGAQVPSTQYGQPQLAAQPSNQYGQPQFGAQPSNQYGQPQFGAQPSNQYGQPQFGAQPNHQSQPIGAPSHQFGLSSSQNQFGANSQYNQPQSAPSNGFASRFGQDSATSRQYLAPKTQEIPQQPFDEQTGYQY